MFWGCNSAKETKTTDLYKGKDEWSHKPHSITESTEEKNMA